VLLGENTVRAPQGAGRCAKTDEQGMVQVLSSSMQLHAPAYPRASERRDDATGATRCRFAYVETARVVVFHQAAAGRHLLDVARQVVGVVAATPAHVLLDAVAFAVVEEPCLAGGVRRHVLHRRARTAND
jgi:L-lactate utilization protein LutC